jgi:hypothetical protein
VLLLRYVILKLQSIPPAATLYSTTTAYEEAGMAFTEEEEGALEY